MPDSVLDAIRLGMWDFEPDDTDDDNYEATHAMPGTGEKLEVMARRVQLGLPLWHPCDRRTYDEPEVIET